MPKSIADRAPGEYTIRDRTKGDIRYTAPPLLAPAAALQEALDLQARVLDEELRAVWAAAAPSVDQRASSSGLATCRAPASAYVCSLPQTV